MFFSRPAAPQAPSLTEALIPVVCLVVLLALGFLLFGDGAASGPNQIALVFSTMVAVLVAWRRGHALDTLRDAGGVSVTTGLGAVFILLAVGALIGSWALSGTLLAMVYYGMQLLSPNYFYMSTCLICAAVSFTVGSSWTVAGTIGLGLMGIAQKMGLDPAVTAGAIVSGAYFGDKSSPMSGSTNLACAASGVALYDHIRATMWTSAPTLLLALGLFWALGEAGDFDATETLADIEASGAPISLWSFLPLAAVLGLALLQWPPFTTIFIGSLLGGALAVVTAPERVIAFAGDPALAEPLALLKGVWQTMASGYVSSTGVETIDTLQTRGGMESMLTTIWLIITALAFGGIVEKAGILDRLITPIIERARSTVALVAALVGSAISTNLLASDQYIAIVLPGRMFKSAFAERGLPMVALSRATGDSAAVTSPLIPWNSCGAYMSATLGVATLSYAPFAFFNLLNPLATILFAAVALRSFDGERATPRAG